MNTCLNTKLITSLSSVLYIPVAEIREAAAITNGTWYRIMSKPSGITIQQLLAISNSMSIPVKRFFRTDRVQFIGKRDDYVADPYTPCYYDNAALQELVSTRTDATWQKAAKKVGMSWSRARKSLLAVTRTPVVRFLDVCDTFGIDPFTILIDPNPVPKERQGKRNAGKSDGNDALLGEIGRLREDIRTLSATVDDLISKYEALLEAHNRLEHRVSVNIGTVNNSNIGIAAEPKPGR